MIKARTLRQLTSIGCALMLAATAGCAFGGVNSLPLPGAVGRGPDARTYHVEIANVGTLEPNSPVLVDDVVVGSIARMRVKAGHADVEVSVRPDVSCTSQRDRDHRSNESARVQSPGPGSAARAAPDRSIAGRRDAGAEPVVDLPLYRTDPRFGVGAGQLWWSRPDRRHHPQHEFGVSPDTNHSCEICWHG